MSVVGLDFGSVNSVVALARRKGIDVVLNTESKRETPSMVNFGDKQVRPCSRDRARGCPFFPIVARGRRLPQASSRSEIARVTAAAPRRWVAFEYTSAAVTGDIAHPASGEASARPRRVVIAAFTRVSRRRPSGSHRTSRLPPRPLPPFFPPANPNGTAADLDRFPCLFRPTTALHRLRRRG